MLLKMVLCSSTLLLACIESKTRKYAVKETLCHGTGWHLHPVLWRGSSAFYALNLAGSVQESVKSSSHF